MRKGENEKRKKYFIQERERDRMQKQKLRMKEK